jgi:MFS family permease
LVKVSYWKFIRQDWPLLGFGLLLTALSGPGQTFFVGLFRDPIAAHFDISIGDFGLIFSTATLVSAVIFFWTGKLIDRWSVSFTITVFTVLFAAAAALVGLAPHVAILAIGIFGIRHVGQALMGHVSSTTMARFFLHNRAKAASLAAMGYSISEAIFPICVVALLGLVGWRFTWVLIAGVIVVVFLPLAHLLLRVNKRDLSLDQEVATGQSGVAVSRSAERAGTSVEWTRKDVLRDKRFWMIFPALLGAPYLLTGLFFHQASLASESGLGLEVIAGFFTIFAISKILGSLIMGPVVDRFGYLKPYPFCVGLLGLSLVVLGTSGASAAVLLFYALSGFAVGAGIPVSGALWPGLYGTRHLGAIRSMLSSVMVLATGLAPASYGYMLDAGVTIRQIAMGGALYTALALLPLVFVVVLEGQKHSQIDEL